MKKRNQAKSPRPTKLTFWDAVRELRTAKGMTQEELSERVREKADAPWISRVEAGKKDISFRTALRIAQALGASLSLDEFRLVEDDRS